MWEATVGGRKLNFHLAGINNQNFIMRDEETGSWWQQVTGEAIQGPLKGEHLHSVFNDELTFALWRRENPQGRVLRPDEEVARNGGYVPADWEERMAKVPIATSQEVSAALSPRSLVVGVNINGVSKAYPFDAVVKQSPILDDLDGVPILLVLGDDKRSVRAYERTVDGRKLELFVRQDGPPLRLVDAETGTLWDFEGKAVEGALAGRELKRVSVLSDYWFDWQTYHAQTLIYTLGER